MRPALLLAAIILLGLGGAARGIEVDTARSTDPPIAMPETRFVLSPAPIPLWIAALSAPEADLRREAAVTIAKAHRLGMPELQTAIPALVASLEPADQPPVVVQAVAQALIALDARQAAPQLLALSKAGGTDTAEVIEPALAAWDYRPAREVWLRRVSDPRAPRGLRLAAIRCLGTVGEPKAAAALEKLALDPVADPAMRIEAARAWGRVRTEGLEPVARRLLANDSSPAAVDRLIGIALLGRHDGDESKRLLEQAALDVQPAVAGMALERLLELDYRRILPMTQELLQSSDSKVRRLTVEALVRQAETSSVAELGPVLDDPHPEIRGYVRESLLTMSGDASLRGPVLKEAWRALRGDRWRELEQAVLMLVALDQKEAVARFIDLLEFDRAEVHTTAAWGLRKMAVPETAAPILEKAQRLEELQRTVGTSAPLGAQFCHLAEALGQLEYAPADDLLRKYIPKSSPYPFPARAAAIWALGRIHANAPPPDLVQRFIERADDNGIPPESEEVRVAAAIAVGRMKAESAIPVLRRYYLGGPAFGTIDYACGWALSQITGEPVPVIEPYVDSRSGWFLEPFDEKNELRY